MTLCLSVCEKDLITLKNYLQLETHEGLIELLSEGNIDQTIKAFFLLKKLTKAKIILTMRSVSLGGEFLGSEEHRCQRILQLLSLCSPDYLDLESSLSKQFIAVVKSLYPQLKIILSYHNFSQESINIEKLFLSMQQENISYYKIASTITGFEELSGFIDFLIKQNNLVLVILGEKWSWTRILFPFLGSCWSYCSLHGKEKCGQLSIDVIKKEYEIKRTFDDTPDIYALLGNIEGIQQSPGHMFHNEHCKKILSNSLYLKIPINKGELYSFISFSKKYGFFKGFSVTTPFKQEVISFLDEINEEALRIGAVNTVQISKKKTWKGYNTDGLGAFDYLEDIYGACNYKTVAILGSGGASLALLYEGLKRGLKIFIFSRNKNQRKIIRKKFPSLKTDNLSNFFAHKFDVIINTIPPGVDMEFVEPICSNIVLDISKSSFCLTPLLRKALKKNANVAYGYGMFVYQALRQCHIFYS